MPDQPKPTLRQKMLLKGFEVARLMCDPIGFASDEEQRARNEIEARLKFYLLNDINKSVADDFEGANNFTDEERLKYFGKRHLQIEDITWEKLEAILRPREQKAQYFASTKRSRARASTNNSRV